MEIFLDTLKWSIIVGVLALALALLRPALEKRYEARWRYWAWLVLAALALLAPVQWEKLLPVPDANAPVVIDVPEMEVQVIQGERPSLALRPAYAAPPVGTEPEAWRTWQLAEVLPKLWLGGAGVFALYTLAGTWLFRHKARRWSRKPKEETARIYASVREDMGLKKAPPLRISSAVGSPMLVGLLRPCLYLPEEKWRERELSFILRHELTHYRRHDLWYKLALLWANALHWFNPLLYLLVREASADLELTCDDEVVFGADQADRRAYSEALLGAVRRHKGLGASLSTHFYGGKKVMMERFRNILGRQRRKWGLLALVLTLLIAAVSACAFGIRQAEPAAETGEPTASTEPEELSGPDKYIADQVARLAGERVSVIDQRSEFTMIDSFSWDFYDSEVQVWALDYALKLEHPEAFFPAGEQAVDADGWLTGIEGGLGDPRFIYSVYRGEEEPEIRLLEIAYSYVEWEEGYDWEEYACCHTIFDMNLTGILGGWPELSSAFVQSMLDGHETWATDWEDVALSYLAAQGEDPSTEGLSPLIVWTFDEESSHDESRLVTFMTASGRTGSMLLTHIVYPVPAWNTTLRFWQVAGCRWDDETEMQNAEAFMRQFLDYEAAGDADNAIAMECFTNNWESGLKYDAIKSGNTIQSYEILSGEKINSRLYAFCIEALYNGKHETFYNFVTIAADGSYHIACNIANIDVTISGGADLSRFEVDDPNDLGRPEDWDDWDAESPLTAAELGKLTTYFNGDGFRNGLLRFAFSGGLDELASNLGILFYDAGEPVTDQEELDAVTELAGGELEVDCTKLTTDYILDSLNEAFAGVRCSKDWVVRAASEQFPLYLPEYDAYYLLHGDTNRVNYNIASGVLLTSQEVVRLEYRADIWEDGELLGPRPMTLTLTSNGSSGWRIVSNIVSPW